MKLCCAILPIVHGPILLLGVLDHASMVLPRNVPFAMDAQGMSRRCRANHWQVSEYVGTAGIAQHGDMQAASGSKSHLKSSERTGMPMIDAA
jgi:hypothetical protein